MANILSHQETAYDTTSYPLEWLLPGIQGITSFDKNKKKMEPS